MTDNTPDELKPTETDDAGRRDEPGQATYQDPCPKCGARLIGFTKADYIAHLRENGENIAARIVEEMVVEEPDDCADANPEEGLEDCADATGRQKERCLHCGHRTVHKVWAKAGENGTVAKKRCTECGDERTEYTLPRGCGGANGDGCRD